MRWEDERYVRVYTRDTAELVALGWEARALMWEIMRKCDRAGILKLGRTGPRGLAGLTGIPPEVVERALPLLVADGCAVQTEDGIVIPNFLEAQETPHSGPMRQREWRARNRDVARRDEMSRSRDETFHERDETSPKRDAARRDVTRARRGETSRDSVLCCTVPCHAVPEIARSLREPAAVPVAGGSDPPDPTGANGTGGASPPDPVALPQDPGQETLSDFGRTSAPSPPSEALGAPLAPPRRARDRGRTQRRREPEQIPVVAPVIAESGGSTAASAPAASAPPTTSPAICLHCGKPTGPRLHGHPHKVCADRAAQRLAREQAGDPIPDGWVETVKVYFDLFAAANGGAKPVFGKIEGVALRKFMHAVGATRAQQIIRAAFGHPWWKDKSLTLQTILKDPSRFLAGNGAPAREESMLQQPAKSPASRWQEAEPLRLPEGSDPWDLKGPPQ